MTSYAYMKEYIATHPEYRTWKKQYMTKYMREYRNRDKAEYNRKRREYMARIRINKTK